MKIAYIILAHKLPQQLIHLVNKLDNPDTVFLIHIDKKTQENLANIVIDELRTKSNVYFLKRINVYWGDFSQVSATLSGISKLFEEKIDFDYVRLLTGQDYPIKSTKKINNFLEENHPKSFLEHYSLPHQSWIDGGELDGGLNRIIYPYLAINISWRNFNLSHKYRIPLKRHIPNQISQTYVGSAYFFFSKNCAEYINDFVKTNPKIINFFKYVDFPDELFFQTILLNSPLKHTIVNNDLTYTEWKGKCIHPEILSENSLEYFNESSYLFARKFDIEINRKILDLIDKTII